MGIFDRFKRSSRSRDGATTTSRSADQLQPGSRFQYRGQMPSPAAPSTLGPFAQPRFVVVDVETTGLSASSDRIIEIAMVTTDPWGRVLEEWSSRLNPQGPIGATHVHGLTAADVAHAPLFNEVVDQLNLRLSGAAVCAHNARFDLAFLRAEYARAGWRMPFVPALCTLEASSHHLPDLERRRLTDCCWAVGQALVDAHSALGDARGTAGLLAAFMHPHIGLPPRLKDLELPRDGQSVVWPIGKSGRPLAVPATAATFDRSRPLSDQARRNIAATTAAQPSKSLVELIERFSLVDALDEGAPAGALAYLEKLAEVLEDGVLSTAEATDLAEVATIEGLSAENVATTNRAFVLTLAHEALSDGKVTLAEKAELTSVAHLLAVDAWVVPAVLEQALASRHFRLGANLQPLPEPWPHGEPLRVGDKIVFTGCDAVQRERLERGSEQLGVRIMGNVSAKTAMVVTDGTMDGTKLGKANALDIRVVHPDQYAILLKHVQPAHPHMCTDRTARVSSPDAALITASPLKSLSSHAQSSHALLRETPPAVVRAWAKQNGWEVGVRGRLPRPLLNAYMTAHPAAPGGHGAKKYSPFKQDRSRGDG